MCWLFSFPSLEKNEKEQVTQVKCPHKIKNTPWISFRNNCYTFMITKNRWREMKSQEAHHLCKKMSKFLFTLWVLKTYKLRREELQIWVAVLKGQQTQQLGSVQHLGACTSDALPDAVCTCTALIRNVWEGIGYELLNSESFNKLKMPVLFYIKSGDFKQFV